MKPNVVAMVSCVCLTACCRMVSSAWSPVVLVMMDGFRHDYVSKYPLPHLDHVASEGLYLPRLQAGFPAARLPFLTSLLTGAHAERHQVISDLVQRNDQRRLLASNQSDFWHAARQLSTLWNLEQTSRVDCRWPGSTFLIAEPAKQCLQWPLPNATESEQEQDEHWERLVNTTVSLVSGQTAQAHFVTLYLPEPGRSAEIFGPDSPEVQSALAKVNEKLGKLTRWLKQADLTLKVNLLLAGSPGFVGVRADGLIQLKESSKLRYKLIGSSPVLNVQPLNGTDLEDYVALRRSEGKYDVYIKEDIPKAWHYAGNDNIVQPILLVAKEGHAFNADFVGRMRHLDAIGARRANLTNIYGCSGYEPSLDSMHTILVARGPSFRDKGALDLAHQPDNISVVDLFALITHLLQGGPTWLDGRDADEKRVTWMLRTITTSSVDKVKLWLGSLLQPDQIPLTIGLGAAGTLVLALMVCVIVMTARKRRRDLASGYRYSKMARNRRFGSNERHNAAQRATTQHQLGEEADETNDTVHFSVDEVTIQQSLLAVHPDDEDI